MTPTHLTTLRALAMPGDLWPDVLGSGARVVFGVTPGRVVLRRPSGSVVVSLEPYDAPPMEIRRLSMLRADLCDKATRAHVAHLMAAGLRCPTCADHVGLRLACPTCLGTGWIRRPASAWHLLPADECNGGLPPELAAHAPALLACHVASVAAGGVGVRGVLSDWITDPLSGLWRDRVSLAGSQASATERPHGWAFWGSRQTGRAGDRTSGPETGPAGMAAADAAALAAGFALRNADGLALPWPDLSVGGSDGRR